MTFIKQLIGETANYIGKLYFFIAKFTMAGKTAMIPGSCLFSE